MHIGLYFGTFNPIHVGHLIIANYIVEHTDLDEVWFVVTPHNPLKDKRTLLDDHHRLYMVQLAISNFPKLKASDVEFKMVQPNYTIHTLSHLTDKFPQHIFSLIMGEDNLRSFHKWKNYEQILANYEIYVYPRKSDLVDENLTFGLTKIHQVHAPIMEISSTVIRNDIKSGKNVRPMLSDSVWQYIDHNLLYRK